MSKPATQAPPTKTQEPVVTKPAAPPAGMTTAVATTPPAAMAIPEYTGEGSGGSALAALMYFGPKAKGERPEQCKAAGIGHHEFYLKDSLGVVKLSPARVFVIGDQTRCYAQFDDEFKMLAARPWLPGGAPEANEDGRWSEYVFGPCLVPNDADDGLSPVIFSTNGPLCNLWKAINEAQKQVAGQGLGFAGRSKAHKDAVACKYPTGRFVAKVRGKEEKPVPPAKYSYNKGFSDISPTTEKQRALVVDYLENTGIAGLLAVYERRKADLQKLIDAK